MVYQSPTDANRTDVAARRNSCRCVSRPRDSQHNPGRHRLAALLVAYKFDLRARALRSGAAPGTYVTITRPGHKTCNSRVPATGRAGPSGFPRGREIPPLAHTVPPAAETNVTPASPSAWAASKSSTRRKKPTRRRTAGRRSGLMLAVRRQQDGSPRHRANDHAAFGPAIVGSDGTSSTSSNCRTLTESMAGSYLHDQRDQLELRHHALPETG